MVPFYEEPSPALRTRPRATPWAGAAWTSVWIDRCDCEKRRRGRQSEQQRASLTGVSATREEGTHLLSSQSKAGGLKLPSE